jgi:hypothetical protein
VQNLLEQGKLDLSETFMDGTKIKEASKVEKTSRANALHK